MRRIAIGVALLLAACQAGPAPRAPKATALSPASAQPDLAGTTDPTGLGRLAGRTEWPGLTPHTPRITGTLSLIGDEPATFGVKRSREFGLGDRYGFKDAPAGRYRIVAVIDETTIWNESVTVEAGKDTTLTLGQSSSPVPADRFPPPATLGADGS